MELEKWQKNGLPTVSNLWTEFFDKDLFNHSNKRLQHAVPAANIWEENQEFKIELAVPGMKKDDFTISVKDSNLLSVSARRQDTSEQNDEERQWSRREFSSFTFSREFRLPQSVDLEKISASYESGILKLSIPKKEEAITKEIKIIEVS